MKLKQISLTLLTVIAGLLLFISPKQASAWCATEELKDLKEHPELLEKVKKANERARNYSSPDRQRAKSDEPEYIIPVVFHVFHNDGDGNIHNHQILQGLEQLNKDMRLNNEDADEIIEEFEDIATDTRIEFRLATKDPDGEETSGINRVNSSLTNSGGIGSLVDRAGWDHERYFNIFIVNSLRGGAGGLTLGRAVLPMMADEDQDGIVVRHDALGEGGTVNPRFGRTLTHEIGHYLGLFHTFQDGCPEDPETDWEDHGDLVDDTPPAGSDHQACDTEKTSCNSLDNIQNHMDYSACRVMFTEGQKERMEFFLNDDFSPRDQLHTEENLEATDIREFHADFYLEEQFVCTNTPFQMQFELYRGEEEDANVSWEFTQQETNTSVTHDEIQPEVTLAEPGSYDVEVEVEYDGATETFRKENYIDVSPGQANYSESFFEDFEKPATFEDEWINLSGEEHFLMSDYFNWEHTNETGFLNSSSIFVNNFDSPSNTEKSTEILLPTFSPDSEESGLKFHYSYFQETNDVLDLLRIKVSDDCGENWSIIEQMGPRDLNTYDKALPPSAPYFPNEGDEEEWDEHEVDLGNFARSDNIWVKFQFRSGENRGSNLFIDNIILGDQSVEADFADHEETDINIYPNPTSEEFNLEFDNHHGGESSVRVYSMAGEELYSGTIEETGQTKTWKASELNISDYGLYLMEVKTQGETHTEKIGYFPR